MARVQIIQNTRSLSVLCTVLSALVTSSVGMAEINLVEPGKRVQLLSSEQKSKYKADDPEIQNLERQVAQSICSSVDKVLVRTTPVVITGEELLQIYQNKAYKANVAYSVQGGVAFQDGTFVLHSFPDLTPMPLSQKIETGCWISTGVFGVGGGLVTLITLVSDSDLQAVMITGIISAVGTGLSAASATTARIYRKCKTPAREDFAALEDIESQVDALSREAQFALPTLVSEIWCN